ncbi:MAG TPA: LysR family transcriptional regulator [Candidatus Dormibacteraeota bacterium]
MALQAVAETGSFWAAAEVLEVSQSAISQQIAALERIAGQRLVERSRGRRTVELTEPGRLLLRHAEVIVAQLRAAVADLRAYQAGDLGELRVGVYQSVSNRILPRLLREFARDYPGVTVVPNQSGSDDELLEMVRRGELDLTFTVYPLPEGPFDAEEMMRDPYVALLPADSALAATKGVLRFESLAGQDFIASNVCRTSELLDQHLNSRGVEPHVVFRSDDNGTVQSMVGAGMGVAVVPWLAVDEHDPHVVVRPLPANVPPRVIVIAYHRDRYLSPPAARFISLAKRVFAEFGAEVAPPGSRSAATETQTVHA